MEGFQSCEDSPRGGRGLRWSYHKAANENKGMQDVNTGHLLQSDAGGWLYQGEGGVGGGGGGGGV